MGNGASVGRGVAIIIVAGAVLGVAYNAAGLMGRPARGIPWLAKQQEPLPELDTLATQVPPAAAAGQAPAGGSAAVATPPAATPPGASAPSSTPASRAPVTVSTGGAPAAMSPKRPGSVPASAPAAPDPPPTAAGGASTPAAAGTAAAATAPATPQPAAPFIPDSGQPVSVRIGTVKALFDAGAALFLDARDPDEYEAGHIPGALRVTHMDLLSEPERIKTLPAAGRPIVAYCAGGACEASHDLARVLSENGYRKVLVYTGGFPEWAAAGHPVERGSGGK